LDRLLDRTVIPGYSRLGYALRRRAWPDDADPDALAGRQAVVTGAGRGLGEAAALGLARLGATVHLVVRDAERAAPAVERISAELERVGRTPDLRVGECDVADLTSVRDFAREFSRGLESSGRALDVIIHNAGVMPDVRTMSPDGHELTMATHVLGPVLMTELLLPVLGRSDVGARTIFVSSGGQYTQRLESDDLEFEKGRYRGSIAYARSKRLQVELAPVLARRWDPETAVYAMHPGWADTPGVVDALPAFHALAKPLLRSATAGADTTVWLASAAPQPPTGTFWHDRQQRPKSYVNGTKSSLQQLRKAWEWVCETLELV
jgi:NAD(P)-dependent dehydrogenase (short-subunit alcohol dehydrogenase family)